MLATSRGWRRQFSHPEMQRPPASISGCNGSIRDVVDIFGCLRHPKMHEAIQDARSNSGCARILNCFMHLGMLEAIEIRMEIVSGNFRCLSISNCGFPAPDDLCIWARHWRKSVRKETEIAYRAETRFTASGARTRPRRAGRGTSPWRSAASTSTKTASPASACGTS